MSSRASVQQQTWARGVGFGANENLQVPGSFSPPTASTELLALPELGQLRKTMPFDHPAPPLFYPHTLSLHSCPVCASPLQVPGSVSPPTASTELLALPELGQASGSVSPRTASTVMSALLELCPMSGSVPPPTASTVLLTSPELAQAQETMPFTHPVSGSVSPRTVSTVLWALPELGQVSGSVSPRTVSTVLWALLELGQLRVKTPRRVGLSSSWNKGSVTRLLNCTLQCAPPSPIPKGADAHVGASTISSRASSGAQAASTWLLPRGATTAAGARIGGTSGTSESRGGGGSSSSSRGGEKMLVGRSGNGREERGTVEGAVNMVVGGSGKSGEDKGEGKGSVLNLIDGESKYTLQYLPKFAAQWAPGDLAGALTSLTQLGLRPTHTWAQAAMSAACASLSVMGVRDLTALVIAISRQPLPEVRLLLRQPSRGGETALSPRPSRSMLRELVRRESKRVLVHVGSWGGSAHKAQVRAAARVLVATQPKVTVTRRQARVVLPRQVFFPDKDQLTQLTTRTHELASGHSSICIVLLEWLSLLLFCITAQFERLVTTLDQLTQLMTRIHELASGLSMRQLALLMRALAELDQQIYATQPVPQKKKVQSKYHPRPRIHTNYQHVFQALLDRALELVTGGRAVHPPPPSSSGGRAAHPPITSSGVGGRQVSQTHELPQDEGWLPSVGSQQDILGLSEGRQGRGTGGRGTGGRGAAGRETDPQLVMGAGVLGSIHPADVAVLLTAVGRLQLRPPQSFPLTLLSLGCVTGDVGGDVSYVGNSRIWEEALLSFSEPELARCICAFGRITSSPASLSYKPNRSNPSLSPTLIPLSDAAWEWLLAGCCRLRTLATASLTGGKASAGRASAGRSTNKPGQTSATPGTGSDPRDRVNSPDGRGDRQADNHPRVYTHLVDAALHRLLLHATRTCSSQRMLKRISTELSATRSSLQEVQCERVRLAKKEKWLKITRRLMKQARVAYAQKKRLLGKKQGHGRGLHGKRYIKSLRSKVKSHQKLHHKPQVKSQVSSKAAS
eukprot:gene3992-14072_t